MLLKQYDRSFQISEAGAIHALAELLSSHYMAIGYSLAKEDIIEVLKTDFLFYAGWAITKSQLQTSFLIDQNSVISVGEWGILEAVVRAHINFIQAQRMEASGAMGGDRFGLTSSEAEQAYSLAKETMKKEAFVETPFTIDYDYHKPQRFM
jgi:hypothetical protein